MNDKINVRAYEIVIDEPSLRFFLIGGSVWVYDLKTNEKIARLNDISYPTYVYVSHKNNIVLVQSTDGRYRSRKRRFLLRRSRSPHRYSHKNNIVLVQSTDGRFALRRYIASCPTERWKRSAASNISRTTRSSAAEDIFVLGNTALFKI